MWLDTALMVLGQFLAQEKTERAQMLVTTLCLWSTEGPEATGLLELPINPQTVPTDISASARQTW